MVSIFYSVPSCNTRKSAFLCDTNAIRVVGAPVNTRICFLRKAVECKESGNAGQALKGKNSPSRELSRRHPHSDQGDGLSSRRMSSLHDQVDIKCSFKHMFISKTLCAHVFSCLSASVLLLSLTNLAMAAELTNSYNFLRIGTVLNETKLFNTDKMSDGRSGNLMMMRGMTAKNFDPSRYSGRWFEVASLKRGFAGQGQEDCHCTQGVYTFDVQTPSIQVDTFCIHGGPDGYITGIRGRVQCLSEEDKQKAETDLEKQEMIREKCYLRFPTLPFIPKEPYDVIATDYDNFALVSGAKDKSFIQIYSRTPDPGPAFIEKYKSYLENFGYDRSQIKDTPQDCEVMSSSQLALMMSMSGMKEALTNQFPDLELKNPIEVNPFTNIFATLKKLIELYFK